MIAVDTNVIVRYAVRDDYRQAVAATEFLRSNACLLLKTVLLEIAWVLSSTSGYNLSRSVVAERLRHICGLPTITVEDATVVSQAISWYEQGVDVADALHLAQSADCTGFATMDRKLVAAGSTITGACPILKVA